jgi:dolichol-phosphate mannosyltransferase
MSGAKLLAVVRDDGDETLRCASVLASDTILQTSKGKGKAFTEALRHIRNNGGPPSNVVLIDADGTYPADRIDVMLRILREQPEVGMVLGNRFGEPNGNGYAIFNPYYVGNRLLAMAHRMLNGVGLADPLTGLRAIRYSLIDGWEPLARGFDLEAELNNRIASEGGSICEIPVAYRHRVGEKKLRIYHGFGILLRMLKCFVHGRSISRSG